MADQRQVAEAAVAQSDAELKEQHAIYHDRTKGRPTPTQKECNLIKAGAGAIEKSPDGAGADPGYMLGADMAKRQQRQMTAAGSSGGGYATRAIEGREQPSTQQPSAQPPTHQPSPAAPRTTRQPAE